MFIRVHCPCRQGREILEPGYADHHPLGGSETAVVRLAEVWRAGGHRVEVTTDANELAAAAAAGAPDVFLASRDWRVLLGPESAAARWRYLWSHDDTDQPFLQDLRDPETAAALWSRCHGAACVSHYQAGRFGADFHLGAETAFVVPNGVPVAAFDPQPSRLRDRPRRAYYASVPHRGLDHLLTAWPAIRGAVPGAELWIFGYQPLDGPGADDFMRTQARRLEGLEGVTYHGGVGQAELRRRAATCRALAYPSVYPETSCIAALEAMAAGCAVVGTALGALPETAWRNPLVSLHGRTLQAFAVEVARVLADDDWYETLARHNLALAPLLDWGQAARRWEERWALDAARA